MRCTEPGIFHSRLKCRDHSCVQRSREESSQHPSRSTKFEALRQLLFLFCALSLFARKVYTSQPEPGQTISVTLM
jgi:hypothetical protein